MDNGNLPVSFSIIIGAIIIGLFVFAGFIIAAVVLLSAA